MHGPAQGSATTEAPDTRLPPASLQRDGKATSSGLKGTRDAWQVLTAYERFEQVIALVLTFLIAVIVVIAVVHLVFRILSLILQGLVDPAEQQVFQAVFGMVMTVLIALEFNHSILGVLQRRHGIVHLRTVVLIALLALVRKFIIIDAAHAAPSTLLGLAASVLSLGAVYWLVRDQDRQAVVTEDPRGQGAPTP
ncbi:phosphate-starvation-inducible PsiE family protein [Sabulicella rubraurantiaca]|uniref:phosphate-starvation-inducible PsiE family protein n=1 Tax=Sabulicella rubraurantiaca TaxID=2811429 RepID=UPI001A96FC61|nr:phosphate-starvation-inducible PsiE family protein [Sabulicella rubraurantiaca]